MRLGGRGLMRFSSQQTIYLERVVGLKDMFRGDVQSRS